MDDSAAPGSAPGWTTVTTQVVFGVVAVAKVRVAVRAAPALYVAYTYTDLSPVPEVGDIVNHDVFDEVTVHEDAVDRPM